MILEILFAEYSELCLFYQFGRFDQFCPFWLPCPFCLMSVYSFCLFNPFVISFHFVKIGNVLTTEVRQRKPEIVDVKRPETFNFVRDEIVLIHVRVSSHISSS